MFLSAFVHVKLQEERRGTNEKERAEGKYTDGGVSGRRKAAVPASGDINLDSIPAFEWPPPPPSYSLRSSFL